MAAKHRDKAFIENRAGATIAPSLQRCMLRHERRIGLKPAESVLASAATSTLIPPVRHRMLPRSRHDLDRRLDEAAPRFDDHDFVHEVTRQGLLARLEPMTISARHVLDLGRRRKQQCL